MARPVSQAAPPPRTTVTRMNTPNEPSSYRKPCIMTPLVAGRLRDRPRDFRPLQQLPPGAGHRDEAVDHDIAAMRELERVEGILLDQKHGQALLRVEFADGVEDLLARSAGARPSDGSSSSSRRGRAISARAIASICCSPPDSVPPRWCRRSLQAREQREHALEIVARSGTARRWSAPICRFSSTVMRGKMRRPSGDCAMRSRAISWVGICVMSRPSKMIVPSRARGLPQIVIISVDLPAPLAPISVTISPSLTSMIDALQRDDVAVVGLRRRGRKAAEHAHSPTSASTFATSSSSTPR